MIKSCSHINRMAWHSAQVILRRKRCSRVAHRIHRLTAPSSGWRKDCGIVSQLLSNDRIESAISIEPVARSF